MPVQPPRCIRPIAPSALAAGRIRPNSTEAARQADRRAPPTTPSASRTALVRSLLQPSAGAAFVRTASRVRPGCPGEMRPIVPTTSTDCRFCPNNDKTAGQVDGHVGNRPAAAPSASPTAFVRSLPRPSPGAALSEQHPEPVQVARTGLVRSLSRPPPTVGFVRTAPKPSKDRIGKPASAGPPPDAIRPNSVGAAKRPPRPAEGGITPAPARRARPSGTRSSGIARPLPRSRRGPG
jgi:hypothetical protein